MPSPSVERAASTYELWRTLKPIAAALVDHV
jgi:hypothetical protein